MAAPCVGSAYLAYMGEPPLTCTTCMTIIIGTLGHRGVGTFSVGSGPNGQEVDQIRREIQIYIDFEGTLGVFFTD